MAIDRKSTRGGIGRARRRAGLALLIAVSGAAILASRPAAAQDQGWTCQLTEGPRAGQSVAADRGGPCDDGAGSSGQAVRRGGQMARPPAPAMAAARPATRSAPRPAIVSAAPERVAPPRAAAAGAYIGGLTGAFASTPRAGTAEFASSAPLGTRLFTPPIYDIPRGYGAVAVLAFPHPPADADERARYLAACAAYVTVLPDSAVASAFAPDRPQMVTLWPRDDLRTPMSVQAPASSASLTQLCDAAVAHYAYLAADGWLSQLPRTVAFDRAARGPFLVAWAPPTALGRPNVPILRYDLSDFADASEFTDSFTLWKNEIEDDPSLWASGWDLTRWRLKTRALSDRYAERIFAGLKLVPWIGAR